MNRFFEKLHNLKIMPVVKINNANNAVPLAKALLNGGIDGIEITFRSDAAADSIKNVIAEFPDMLVCAGTILNVNDAKKAVNAGAKAIISPGTNIEVVEWCIKNNIPCIPGCATPTEVEACIRMGLDTVKLFPAEVVGGISMLKALSGPYGNVKFMPTGGISIDNLTEYLALKNVIACGGSWIATEKAIDNGDFAEIEALARQAKQILI